MWLISDTVVLGTIAARRDAPARSTDPGVARDASAKRRAHGYVLWVPVAKRILWWEGKTDIGKSTLDQNVIFFLIFFHMTFFKY